MIIGEEEMKNERQLLTVENGALMQGRESVRYLILHCSATRCDKDYTAEQLLRDHKTRGFRTVGYHFYIRRDGTITQHRKLLEVGAHCRPWNRCSIGICYEGGLDADGHPADTRTAEQTEQLTLLLMRLAKLFPGARIRGHRDMSGSIPKACPCFDAEGVFGYLERYFLFPRFPFASVRFCSQVESDTTGRGNFLLRSSGRYRHTETDYHIDKNPSCYGLLYNPRLFLKLNKS